MWLCSKNQDSSLSDSNDRKSSVFLNHALNCLWTLESKGRQSIFLLMLLSRARISSIDWTVGFTLCIDELQHQTDWTPFNNRKHLVLSGRHPQAIRNDNFQSCFRVGRCCICCQENVLMVEPWTKATEELQKLQWHLTFSSWHLWLSDKD